MLYKELFNLTACQCTYEEYCLVEYFYNADDKMTKRASAKLWANIFRKVSPAPLAIPLKEIKAVIHELRKNHKTAIAEENRIRKEATLKRHDISGEMIQELYEVDTWEDKEIANMKYQLSKSAFITIVYKDWSVVDISGMELVNGASVPKLRDILYAQYQGADAEIDTLVGNLAVWDAKQGVDRMYQATYFELIQKKFLSGPHFEV